MRFHEIYKNVVNEGITPTIINSLSFMHDKMTAPVQEALALKESLLQKIPAGAIIAAVIGTLGVTGSASAGINDIYGGGRAIGQVLQGTMDYAQGTQRDYRQYSIQDGLATITEGLAKPQNRAVTGAATYLAAGALLQNFAPGTQQRQQQMQQQRYQQQPYQQQQYQQQPYQQQQYPQSQPYQQPRQTYTQTSYQNQGTRIEENFPGQEDMRANFNSYTSSSLRQIASLRQNSQDAQANAQCTNLATYVSRSGNYGIVDQRVYNGLRVLCDGHAVELMYPKQSTTYSN